MTRGNPKSKLRSGAAMLVGLTIANAVGLAGFMASFAFFLQKPMTFQQVLTIAVYPFVAFDLVKLVLGAWLAPVLIESLARAGFAERRQEHA